ncbi:MAG: oligoendopeptidase F [Oscillospiraceae bacterium]|nr:oligoendopeptidase F [Oscillospiraceae bacterium]
MSEMKKIWKREEIPVEHTWATEDLYASDALWEADLAVMIEEGKALAAYTGKLNNAENLYTFLYADEMADLRVGRLAGYCMRKSDQDTRNAFYQGMVGKFRGVMVKIGAECSFAVPEMMAISDEDMDRFYAEKPELERYRRYLTNMRRRKAHTLSPAEEKLLAAAGEVAGAPTNIYSMFANADIKFEDAVDALGNKHVVRQGTFVGLEESDDRVLRKSAYESLYGSFNQYKNTAAGLLNAQNKQLKFFAEAKKYNTAFEAALDRNNVPTDVYLNLIEAVHNNVDKMHRYVRLRKKMLGVDELHFYDIYTPLLSGADKYIPIEEAKQTVYDSLTPLGEEYRAVIKHAFENRWIDVYTNEGKRSGAYSSGVKVHPFVLMNYNDTMNSEFTLAHEMGHAMHSYLSNKTQNTMDASYVIFVAEVASTCNEALLMEYLLNKTTDKKERIYLINHFLDQFKGTIYRQTMFAEFELNIGRMVAEGKTLTADVLCAEYKRLNELYYGPDMVVDDHIAMEWARIPHFYYNYYVFQYATGYSAAIALSRRILNEGEEAVKDYIGFLSGGCSKSPIELLRGAGVDMESPAPVNQALELFGKLLDEMEELMA